MSKETPSKQTYLAFKNGLLDHTNNWKELIAEEALIKGPLVNLKGKQNFIAVYESFYESVKSNVIHQLVEHRNLIITQISTTFVANNRRPFTLHMNEWITIQNGKVEAAIIYFDAAALQAADKDRYGRS